MGLCWKLMRQRARRAESSHFHQRRVNSLVPALAAAASFSFHSALDEARQHTSQKPVTARAFFYELSDEWVFSLWNGEHELYYTALLVTTMSAVYKV